MRVVIADDHHIVRKGLVFFLQTQPDVDIIGEASNGEEALEVVRQTKPDIVLMDLSMPIMNGIEATKQIMTEMPKTRIVILTSYADKDYVIPAIQAGAKAYQLKDVAPEKLLTTMIEVQNGTYQLDGHITSFLVQHITDPQDQKWALMKELTNREREVLFEIAKGKSNKEIATSLFISEKTVKTHVSHLLSKLELADRTQAALYAVEYQKNQPKELL
ncbi:response regulator transcription factor [Bacillus sp. Bos-x628]|uniref:response regulator transcription factor n=1 Tax=Bacillus maqinnsis TaxID=3229854 RepID=UPI00338D49B7